VDDLKKNPILNEKYSGEIRLPEKALKTNLGENNFIFVQNMGDLFAENVPSEMIMRVLDHLSEYPTNRYLLQTKNPERFKEFIELFPPKTIVGTTIETNHDHGVSKAPEPMSRICSMVTLPKDLPRMISIEPIMKMDVDVVVTCLNHIQPEYVAIGADSKKHGLLEPTEKDIVELVGKLRPFTEVILKKNLRRLAPSLF
jgi:protein gp37